MHKRRWIICFVAILAASSSLPAQEPIPFAPSDSRLPPVRSTALFLPSQQVPLEPSLELSPAASVWAAPTSTRDSSSWQAQLIALMRPTFGLSAEWQAESSDVELACYDFNVQIPTFPIFGPPPPFVTGGFSYTDLHAPAPLDLPSGLYDYSLGFSWMRPLKERWMLRLMFSTAIATDGQNTTRDAWQYRGGFFALYQPNQEWTWIFGALALGRNDIPVVPAVGAIWQPNPALRVELTLPQPKIAFLLIDQGPRQQWGYVGAGLNGGTWAYERTGGIDDQLTYGDWRVVLGWESTPTPEPGVPFTRGATRRGVGLRFLSRVRIQKRIAQDSSRRHIDAARVDELLATMARSVSHSLRQPESRMTPPKTYEARYVPDANITLDGDLREPAWERANIEAAFGFPWQERPAPSTEFRALFDASALYFAFRVEDDDIVLAERFLRKEDVVREDRVELFFALDEELAQYFCLEIDPLGRVLDYRASHYRQFDFSWSFPGLDVVGIRTIDGYAVEGRIDWEALESLGFPPPDSGRRDEVRHLSCRIPTYSGRGME